MLALGCSSEDSVRQVEPIVRDSAGIRVIEYPSPQGADPVWSVDFEESTSMAADHHSVVGGLRRSDGTFVVADGGDRMLRFFDDQGNLTRTFGGPGEGPGEFRHLAMLERWRGDSILVADWELARLTVVASDGSGSRNFRLDSPRELPGVLVRGVHRDGSILGTTIATSVPSGTSDGGLGDLTMRAHRFSAEGAFEQTLDAAWRITDYYHPREDGGFRIFEPLFPTWTRVLAGPTLLIEATTDRSEVVLRSGSGRIRAVTRLGYGRPSPISEGTRRAALEARLASLGERDMAIAVSDLRRLHEAMPVPDRLPGFSDVFVDRLDNVWLREYAPHHDPDQEARWLILNPEGLVGGTLSLPGRLVPLDAGEDFLLAILPDELLVEAVVSLPLQR